MDERVHSHVMRRGEVWTAAVGGKRRPVLVLTRDAVIDVREFVTVAEITTAIRGIGAEVAFDWSAAGLQDDSVVNCDGIHTVRRRDLAGPVGEVSAAALDRVCAAVAYALGC